MDLKKICICIIAAYLTICIVILLMLLCHLWPNRSICTAKVMDTKESAVQTTGPDQNDNEVNVPTEAEQPDPNSQKSNAKVTLCPVSCLRIVGLVLIMGALGACLHGITSLGFHCSKKNFGEEWTLWYLYRPPVGAVLALIFYLIINGGLMPQANADSNKFFYLLGLSGLVGLFSKQALDRLGKIFNAIFAIENEEPPEELNGQETPQPGPNTPGEDNTANKQGTEDKPK